MKQPLIVFCIVSMSYAVLLFSEEPKKRLTPNPNGDIHVNVEVTPKIEIKSEATAGKLVVEKEDPEDCSKYIDGELVKRMGWLSHEKWLENMARFSKYKREKYVSLADHNANREHAKKMKQNRLDLEKQYGKEFVDHVIDTIYARLADLQEKADRPLKWYEIYEGIGRAVDGSVERVARMFGAKTKYNYITGEWE